MPFLKIQYRDYPKEGLFKKLYRENIYKIEEFKDEFKYYEYTPIEKIIIGKNISKVTFGSAREIIWYN